jgi:hypothetical protein
MLLPLPVINCTVCTVHVALVTRGVSYTWHCTVDVREVSLKKKEEELYIFITIVIVLLFCNYN